MPFIDGLESDIACPKCGPATKLVVRTNHRNRSQFLGCPNWPDCNYSRPIPEEWIMRRQGQPELLGAVNDQK